jgi:hypothetical protein
MSETRPILAVDVDGVLNACNDGPPAPGWQDARVRPDGPGRGFRIRHNPAHGAQLLAVAEEADAELVWCTTWEEMANRYIRKLVRLPELPWVPMEPGRAGLKFSEVRSVGETKAAAMRAYAVERPFCWLDDEPDAAWELRGCPVPHLVVRVDSETGLQEEHLAAARAWLAALAEPAEETA